MVSGMGCAQAMDHHLMPGELADDAALTIALGLPDAADVATGSAASSSSAAILGGAVPDVIVVSEPIFPIIPDVFVAKWVDKVSYAGSKIIQKMANCSSEQPLAHLRHASLVRPEGSGTLLCVTWDRHSCFLFFLNTYEAK